MNWNKVHLQWFGDPDEPIEPVMDVASEFLGNVEIIVGDDEIVEDDATPNPQEPNELDILKQQLAAQQETIQSLMTSNPTQAIQQGFQQMQQAAPQQQQQVPQRLSAAELKTKMAELQYEDPIGSMDLYFAQKLQPELMGLIQNNMYTSRRLTELDPIKGPLYKRYRPQVDQIIAGLPANQRLDPEIYSKVCDQVAMVNSSDIIKEEAEKLAKEMFDKQVADANIPAGKVSPPPPHSETGVTPKPKAKKNTVRITKEQNVAFESRAMALGITKEALVARLKRKGEL